MIVWFFRFSLQTPSFYLPWLITKTVNSHMVNFFLLNSGFPTSGENLGGPPPFPIGWGSSKFDGGSMGGGGLKRCS